MDWKPVGRAWENKDGTVDYRFYDTSPLEEMFEESLRYECPENNKPKDDLAGQGR